MKIISTWIGKISSTRLMILTLLLMAGFMIFVLPSQSEEAEGISGEAGSPDLSFFYLPQDLYQMAENYESEGREAYIRARWTFDLIFPLVYVAFLAVGISWFSQRLSGWPEFWKFGNLLPVLGGLFDLMENTGASLTMAFFPDRQLIWPLLASISTPIKWCFVSTSFLVYFLLSGAALVQWIRK